MRLEAVLWSAPLGSGGRYAPLAMDAHLEWLWSPKSHLIAMRVAVMSVPQIETPISNACKGCVHRDALRESGRVRARDSGIP